MPTLDWIGKKAILNHHNEIPYRALRCDPALSVGDPASGNLIVHGDNLDALKALLSYYAGEVKLIYIDPPYNTGEEGWEYNDNVGSPEIERWLGQVVGKDLEDLSRHDKWLCMMYPRLQLLKQFLRQDGLICVSIDDNEVGHLRLIMDEIFGATNALGSFVWKRRSPSSMGDKVISLDHEYVLAYARSKAHVKLYGQSKGHEEYKFRDDFGPYDSTDLTVGMTREQRPNQFYPITNLRSGTTYEANPNRVWRFTPDTMAQVIADDLVIWPDEVDGRMERPRYKTRFNPAGGKPKPYSTWIEGARTKTAEREEIEEEFGISILTSGMNTESSKLLEAIFGRKAFAYPKPLSLVQAIVQMAARENDMVLDSFAGSATTAHAVLAANALDGQQRRFVLVELEADIARNVTVERVKRVIEGYGTKTGYPGSFRFCTLGVPLFDDLGNLMENVTFPQLARHLYFTETGVPLSLDSEAPFVGAHGDTDYFFLWEDALRPEHLAQLGTSERPRVIFAEGTALSKAFLSEQNVTFKQVPYEVKR